MLHAFNFDASELGRLCSVMDANVDANAATVQGYQLGPPAFRSGGISNAQCHAVVTLAEHLSWLKTNTRLCDE